MILYHATRDTGNADAEAMARAIVEDGFIGNDVWDLPDVVFVADTPLRKFGGWRDAWVAVDVPESVLPHGAYEDKWYDDKQYHAVCYAFPAAVINAFPRSVVRLEDLPSDGDDE